MIFTMTEVPSARFFASETIVWNQTMSETIWKHPAKLRKAKTSLLRYSALCCCTLLYATQLAWYLGDEDLQHRLPRQSGLEVHSESTLNKSFYMPYYMPMVCKQADPENPEAPQKMLRRTQVSGAKVEARTKPAPCVCVYMCLCLCLYVCAVGSVYHLPSLPPWFFLFTETFCILSVLTERRTSCHASQTACNAHEGALNK